jgi:hypothetical protein
MKKFLYSVVTVLFILSCSPDDNSLPEAETTIDINIEKFVFETDSNKIRTYLKWGNTNTIYPYQYFIYNGHGATEFSNPFSNGNGNLTVTLLEPSTAYTIKVQADINGTGNTEEYRFTTPTLQEFDGLFLEIDTNYVGYTAINYSINGLASNLSNQVFINEFDFFTQDPLFTNFFQSELLLSDLPINYAHTEGDFLYNLDIIVYRNNLIGVKNHFSVESRKLYKLPEDDFDAVIYNIQNSSVDLIASNSSAISIYNESTNGHTDYKIYINNDLIGEYQCFWESGSFNESIPTIDNLLTNNAYTLKVEVDYDNEPVDANYEPNIELTTYKEFEFTTYSTPLNSELDVHISNLTSTSFDFTWRTDLSGLYNCSYFQYDYNFILEIDGIEVQTFDTNSRLINAVGLNNNTTYSIKLICNYYYVENNNIIETRISEFEITTLE